MVMVGSVELLRNGHHALFRQGRFERAHACKRKLHVGVLQVMLFVRKRAVVADLQRVNGDDASF